MAFFGAVLVGGLVAGVIMHPLALYRGRPRMERKEALLTSCGGCGLMSLVIGVGVVVCHPTMPL